MFIEKYNTAVPRYTSYPTVPYWANNLNIEHWKKDVQHIFNEKNAEEGISIYIHLPFCESLCTYCGCNTRITKNHQVELPYIETILKEWELYLQIFETTPIIREIHLGGGTPTFFSPKNLNQLIEGILKNAKIHADAEFSFEGHPNNTSFEHLLVLENLGFSRVSIGIQDFSPEVQEAINRFQTYENVEKIVENARNLGYKSVNFDLIYGLPFQTSKRLKDTFQKVLRLSPDRIAFYSYAHVPWVKKSQRKFTEQHLPDATSKWALQELGESMLLQSGYHKIGMDHFAKPNDTLYKAKLNNILNRNFMGYTTSNSLLLVGLGVSSISDSYFSFAQNSKTVEQYIQNINNGILAIEKGHILNANDIKMRKIIQHIMCERIWNIDSLDIDKEEWENYKLLLSDFQNDGLLKFTKDYLEITDLGKKYLRNICSVFDTYYVNANSGSIFSKAI